MNEKDMFPEFKKTQTFLKDYRKLNATATVEAVLRQHPETRNSDKKLILKVWERFGVKVPEEFVEVYLKLPCSESITRSRRKAQEQFVELRADDKIEFARELQDMQMRKDAKKLEVKG